MFAWEHNVANTPRLYELDEIEPFVWIQNRFRIEFEPETYFKSLLSQKDNLPNIYGNVDLFLHISQLRLITWRIHTNKIVTINDLKTYKDFISEIKGEKYESIKSVLPNRSASIISHNRFR